MEVQAPEQDRGVTDARTHVTAPGQKTAPKAVTTSATATSLRRGFSWALAGNLVHALSQWGLIASLARLGSPELVGRLALALALSAPALMLTGLQLRGVQATDAAQRFRFGDYFALRLLGSGVALLLVLIAAVATGYPASLVGVILLITLARAVESLSDVVHGLFHRLERLDLVGRSAVIRGPLSWAALTIAVWSTGSMAIAAMGMVLAAVLVLVLHDLRIARTLRPEFGIAPRWSFSVLQELIRLSAPLGVALMLTSLTVSAPRWVLERVAGEAELGFFAALSYFLTAGMLALSALGQTATARLARLWADSERHAFSHLLLRLVSLAIAAGLSGVMVAHVAGEALLGALYGPEYVEYASSLTLMMGAGLVMFPAGILGVALTSMRQFLPQVPLMLVVVVVTTIVALVSIPSMGLRGAVWTMIAGSAIQLLLSALAIGRAYRDAR